MREEVRAGWTDGQVLDRIHRLASEAREFYAKNPLEGSDGERLRAVLMEMNHCWDLLREGLALRNPGRDLDEDVASPPTPAGSDKA